MRKITKQKISLLMCAVLVAVILGLGVGQVALILTVDYECHDNPKMYTIPISKAIKPFNKSTKQTQDISNSGLTITVPWSDPESISYIGDMENCSIQNGDKLIILSGLFDITKSKKDALDDEIVEKSHKYFGKDSTNSAYEFQKFILEGTPKQLKLLDYIPNTLSTMYRLELKSGAIKALTMYNFNNGVIKGFQIGDQANKDEGVFIVIYRTDNTKYVVAIKGKNITQDNIDFIISSAHFS